MQTPPSPGFDPRTVQAVESRYNDYAVGLQKDRFGSGAAFWDPYREGQMWELDRVQKKAAQFASHTNSPKWETLASRRKIARLGALYKAYCGNGRGKT